MPVSPTLPLRLRVRRAGRVARRVLLARRRLLAALVAGVAVLAGVRAATPPPPATEPVLVAARDLPPGVPLTAEDVEVRDVPSVLLPVGGPDPPDAAAVLGRTTTGPLAAGEPVSAGRLLGGSLLASTTGRVVLPLRLADAGSAALLRPGDRVDLLAADLQGGAAGTAGLAGPPGVAAPLAPQVDVVTVPAAGGDDLAAGAATGGALPGRLVVVAVDPADAGAVAQASAAGFVTFTWSAP